MVENTFSRRSLLKAAGATAATAAAGAAVVNTAAAATASSWSEASSPTTKTLYGVSQTVDGPYAVGKSGNILARENGSWEIVVDDGPSTRNNGLTCVEPTDDNKRIWYAGSSGALGAYDVDVGKKIDYTAPQGKTSTWEGIAVTGKRENEVIYITNGSGEVMRGHHDSKGCVVWDSVKKPGSGSNLAAIDFKESDDSLGFCVDTSSNAFETTDAGGTWSDVGIPNSQVRLLDVHSWTKPDGHKVTWVAGGSGKLYRFCTTCDKWTPYDLGANDNNGIDHKDAVDKLVCGDSGTIYENTDGDDWTKLSSPVSADLFECAYGDSDSPDVIVGDSGTILER